jgi:hypothetical protein
MNASITFRFPALGRPCEDDKPPDVADSSLPAASPSDEAVLEQICHGSAEALSVLFRRYARTIRGVAYNVLRDTGEADDLLQDIFLLVHRLCGTFNSSKGPARFWILQMTYRRAISRRLVEPTVIVIPRVADSLTEFGGNLFECVALEEEQMERLTLAFREFGEPALQGFLFLQDSVHRIRRAAGSCRHIA